eukprot:7940451-Alexandrium_andersonii.AAC.1
MRLESWVVLGSNPPPPDQTPTRVAISPCVTSDAFAATCAQLDALTGTATNTLKSMPRKRSHT